MGIGQRKRTACTRAVPLGETEIARYHRVHAVDGEIARVEGLAVDPDDHRVTPRATPGGLPVGTGGHHPDLRVTAVDDYGISVSLTKQQVKNLPPLG